MAIERMDAAALAECFLAGAANLSAKKELINELNVFPVPDGDTGTNMTMSVMSAVRELEALKGNYTMKSVCSAISMGSLRGARGNSGVILSQLLRGFCKVAEEHEVLKLPVISAAFNKAVETAYHAVMKPKEGTILTVAKGAARKAAELAEKPGMKLADFADCVVKHAEYVLEQTPELLSVLKEAGVVDSGGKGLVEVLKGCADAISGRSVSGTLHSQTAEVRRPQVPREEVLEKSEIKFGYCTEFILELEEEGSFDESGFKAFLDKWGDSIVCVALDGIVKVHVHTNHPGTVFEEALRFGQLTSMKIDNMRKEHNERLFHMNGSSYTQIVRTDEKKKYGFVAVSSGRGLTEIFSQLGVDEVIEGGQTMNPSTEEILKALERIDAETVFILPNNSNIILAASQAAGMCSGKKAVVIPSRTVPQGFAAMVGFNSEASAQENEEEMIEAAGSVKTGQVTYAVRDSEFEGLKIHTGDIMGIGESEILCVSSTVEEAARTLVEKLVDEESEIISLYYGDGVDKSSAGKLSEIIENSYPELEIQLLDGGQSVYYYIISVE